MDMNKKKQLFRLVKVLLLFALAFMAGRFGAMMTDGKQAVETAADGNWGLSFQQEGQPPVANATADYLIQRILCGKHTGKSALFDI